MGSLTPDQVRRRDQVERLIRLMAPALDLVLSAGERLSRLVEPEDTEYYPPRAAREQQPGQTAAASGSPRAKR